MPLSSLEEALEALFPLHESAHMPHRKLFEAARYALFLGGRRLRPRLVLAAASDVGGALALTAACAVELIHTYSLIHDDLPALDDDALRRGKPSVHIAFGEALAILTGDFLLTKAFELIACDPTLSFEQRTLMIATLARRTGSEGMVGGQVVDIANEGVGDVSWINERKTAALFSAALELGGVAAHATQEKLAALEEVGFLFGALYQTLDDWHDQDRGVCQQSLRDAAKRLKSCLLRTPFPCVHAVMKEVYAQALL